MHSLVVTLPLPPRALSPNARVSWQARARHTRRYRRDAYVLTIAAGGQNLRWPRAVAQATFYWPQEQRRDIRNAEHMLKPAYDGLVDAGLIPDDSAAVLTHQPTVFAADPAWPRVEIRIIRADAPSDPASMSTGACTPA